MKKFTQYSVIVLLSFFFVSCSLEKQKTTSTLNISLPSKEKLKAAYHQSKGVSAQSQEPANGFVVSRVILNVRGEGINGIFSRCWSVDGDQECHHLAGKDSLFVPDLPTGQKLVQLVIIADEELSNGDRGDRFLIYYGDKDQKFEPGVVRALLTVKLFSEEDGQGVVKGRFLGTGGKGPTGKLDAYIVPPTGRPAMRITETEIFDGWFTAFSLYEKSFRYVHRDSGTVIIAENSLEPGATDSFVKTATTKERLIVQIPESWDQEQDDNGNPIYERNSPERGVLGYFGPGSAGKMVCIIDFDESGPGDFNDLYADDQGISKLYWDPTDTAPNPTTVGRPFGGELASVEGGTICNETNVFSNALVMHKDMIERDLYSMGWFYGPFRPIDLDVGDFLDGTPSVDGTSVQLQWKFLPGVFDGPSPIQGIKAYVRGGITDMNQFSQQFDGGDGLPCDHDKALSYGFYLAGQTSAGQESMTITGLNMQAPDDTAVMLCPFRDNQNFDFGLSNFRGPGNDNNNNNGNQGPTNKLVLSFNNGGGNAQDYNFGFLDSATSVKLAKDTITHGAAGFSQSWYLGFASKNENGPNFDLIDPADIESLEFSIDGGAFSNVDITTVAGKPAPFGSTVAAIRGDQIDVEAGTAFSGDVNGDTSLKIRFTVTQDYADNHNISNRTFESGDLDFIGRTTCDISGGQNLQLVNEATSGVDFTSILNAGESQLSDNTYTQALYWSPAGCQTNKVIAPIKSANHSGQICFDSYRDYKPVDSGLGVILDWRDPYGRDCDLNGDSITFDSIYFNGASVSDTYNFFSGDVLFHSQAVHQFAPYLSDDIGAAGDKSVLLEAAHLGPGVTVAWRTHMVNTDYKMIDSTNDVSNDKWNAPADMWNSATADQDLGGLFNKTTVAPSSDTGAKLHTVRDAGDVHSDFEFRVQVKDIDQVFFRSSSKFFEGGSPLFIGYSATNPNEARLWHWGDALVQYGSYEGESLSNLTPTASFIDLGNNALLRESVHVESFRPYNGDDNDTIVLAAGDRIMFGMRDDNSGGFTWSNQILFEHSDTTTLIIMGLHVLYNGSQPDLYILARKQDNSGMFLYKFTGPALPYFDGSSWTNYPGAGSPIDETAFGATYGTIGGNVIGSGAFSSPGEIYGFKKCGGGDIAVVAGKDNDGGGSNFLNIWSIGPAGDNTRVGGANSYDPNHNSFACYSNFLAGEMILLTFVQGAATGANTPKINIWNDSGSPTPCGSNGNGGHVMQPWGGLLGSSDVGGGVFIRRDKTNTNAWDIITVAGGPSKSLILNKPIATCGTNPSGPAAIEHGNLPATLSANTIFGLSAVDTHHHGNELYTKDGQRVFIMGENSQIYQTNFQFPAP